MRSIPRSPYSVFKILLVALTILLLLSSVEALPAKGKHNAVALPHAHGTATPGAGGGAKPSVAKRVVKYIGRVAKSILGKRLQHPSPRQAITLFHGTQTRESAESMAKKVNLERTRKFGDLHHNYDNLSQGGAYFTDSIIAAAQYACYGDFKSRPSVVYVLEFKWNPKNYRIYEFQHAVLPAEAHKLPKKYDMISAPMHLPMVDAQLTQHFWQYAVVDQKATAGLKYQTTYEVYCHQVKIGNELSDTRYAQGQWGNPEFNQLVRKLTTAPA